ncbi:MAG TPA: hypothetical protein VF601_20865 [Beijerinckiaceae bacterium]
MSDRKEIKANRQPGSFRNEPAHPEPQSGLWPEMIKVVPALAHRFGRDRTLLTLFLFTPLAAAWQGGNELLWIGFVLCVISTWLILKLRGLLD